MFVFLFSLVSSSRWAILYVGSNTFSNYRHHSNIDTAYQVLIDRGFPKENIILCQYNDIPDHPSNPFKGQLFHSLDHKNIYAGIDAITYTSKNVNAQLFYDILSGNKALKSTSNDDIYIYYDNHGGPGILGVPEGNGDYIKADKLANALLELESKNMYKRIFFMIGACYSYSMVKPMKNKNMAVITSANDHQSAYACTWDSAIGAYLTNEFNLNFDLIVRSQPSVTIGEFFEKMKSSVKQSEICFYGDESMKSLPINIFIGDADRAQILNNYIPNDFADPKTATLRQITNNINEFKLRLTKIDETSNRFINLANYFGQKSFEFSNEIKFNEYYEIISYYENKFGPVHPDDLGEYQLFANLCNYYPLEDIKRAIDNL